MIWNGCMNGLGLVTSQIYYYLFGSLYGQAHLGKL